MNNSFPTNQVNVSQGQTLYIKFCDKRVKNRHLYNGSESHYGQIFKEHLCAGTQEHISICSVAAFFFFFGIVSFFEALFSSKKTICVNQEIFLKELHYVWLFYFAYSNRGKEGNILEV